MGLGLVNRFLVAERDRWPLWLPVTLGAGSGLYFALSAEPQPAMMGRAGRWRWRRRCCWVLAQAKLNEITLATPVLDAPVVTYLTARVVSLEPRGTNFRAVLDQVHSGGLNPLPERVRVSFRGRADVHAGAWLSLTARLDTPR